MRSLTKIFGIFSIVIPSLLAYGEGVVPFHTQLLSCDDPYFGFDCSMKTGYIDHRVYDYEVVFEVDYVFGCISLQTTTPGLSTDSGDGTTINSIMRQQNAPAVSRVSVTGFGPLSLIDSDPDVTWDSCPNISTCQLMLESLSVRPSPNTLNLWQQEQTSLIRLKASKSETIETIDSLLSYEASFNSLKKALDAANTDLLENNELRDSLRPGTPAFSAISKIASATPLLVLDGDTVFNQEERQAAINLMVVLAEIGYEPDCENPTDSPDASCPPVRIADRVVTSDLIKLNELSKKVELFAEYRTRSEELRTELSGIDQHLLKLCHKSRSHIIWEYLPTGCEQ